MRLKPEIAAQLIHYAQRYFGLDVRVYLFGSRVYDERGGIDLYIESEENIDMQTQITFLTEVYKNVT